jgi:hypothetical protein
MLACLPKCNEGRMLACLPKCNEGRMLVLDAGIFLLIYSIILRPLLKQNHSLTPASTMASLKK